MQATVPRYAEPDPAAPPAEILVARARRGDARAFEELYRLHHRRVYALALRMTREPGRAEEVTQDAFVEAWRALPTFRGESAFATWLHGIAARVVLRQMRTDRRWEERLETAADLSAYLAEARRAMPETTLSLERAIASLPDGARAVLVLHDVEGYKYEEIARLLGVALGTVKAQLHRARRLVMEALEA
jgi:RNA polymerase sigma-70 factor (ECF subfamily)